ncbi:MAG: hypothetical protein ACXVB9_01595 [Bdellovibrionota bacterium]
MKRYLITALLLLTTATRGFANEATINPPDQITRAGYLGWLRAINSAVSPYADYLFDWYELQLKSALPSQVKTDPDKLYVNVDHALADTITTEQSGDVEEGTTIGFEAYGLVDVPIETALETKLFNWGKPIGQKTGDTYPYDTVFSSIHNVLTDKWGTGNYFSSTTQTGGGIVQDLHDDYTVLVRGNKTDGYTLFISFFGPNADSATVGHFSIVMLKPTSDGKTEFRQFVMQNGQSYKVFGLEFGRKNFGFNVSRDRQGEKQLVTTMLELKNTGTIKENRPGFDY